MCYNFRILTRRRETEYKHPNQEREKVRIRILYQLKKIEGKLTKPRTSSLKRNTNPMPVYSRIKDEVSADKMLH